MTGYGSTLAAGFVTDVFLYSSRPLAKGISTIMTVQNNRLEYNLHTVDYR